MLRMTLPVPHTSKSHKLYGQSLKRTSPFDTKIVHRRKAKKVPLAPPIPWLWSLTEDSFQYPAQILHHCGKLECIGLHISQWAFIVEKPEGYHWYHPYHGYNLWQKDNFQYPILSSDFASLWKSMRSISKVMCIGFHISQWAFTVEKPEGYNWHHPYHGFNPKSNIRFAPLWTSHIGISAVVCIDLHVCQQECIVEKAEGCHWRHQCNEFNLRQILFSFASPTSADLA